MTYEEIKQLVQTSDLYDFIRNEKRLGNNLILLGLGGSYAYGTNVEGSDIDIRGITYNDPHDLLRNGLVKDIFAQYNDKPTDTVIYSFNKMIKLLAECNPNTIEILGCPKEEYIYLSSIGEELLDLAPAFLSKRCERTFKGYATSQLYRLKQKSLVAMSEEEYNTHISKVLNGMAANMETRYGLKSNDIKAFVDNEGQLMLTCSFDNLPADSVAGMLNELNTTINDYKKNSKRNDKALAHGKINKHKMHLLRLYMMGIDLVTNHQIVTKRVAEHDLLMRVRNGEMPEEEFYAYVDEYSHKFDEAIRLSTLPDTPDMPRIFSFVDRVNSQLIRDMFRKSYNTL